MFGESADWVFFFRFSLLRYLWFFLWSGFMISLVVSHMLDILSLINRACLLCFKVSRYSRVSNTLRYDV
jgi:hypothetical protein